MIVRKIWMVFFLLFFLLSCAPENQEYELQWGHLDDQSLSPEAPHYLINHDANDLYHVCIPSYVKEELPDIELEVKAAINIWSHYINREIKVWTTIVDSYRPKSQRPLEDLKAEYYRLCPKNTDLVLGFAPFAGSTVGRTGSNWVKNYKGQYLSYERFLFLRDLKLTPGYHDGAQNWISLSSLGYDFKDWQQILSLLVLRQHIEINPEDQALALPVLIHEIGHIWGLCDQYEGPSNCDPIHSSSHIGLESIMGVSTSFARLYLSDDDIMGIQKLALRPGFAHQWPRNTWLDFRKLSRPLEEPEVLYFKVKSLDREGSNPTIKFGLVTATKGGRLEFEYKTWGEATWQRYSSYFPSKSRFYIPNYEYTFSQLPADTENIRLVLRLDEEGKSQRGPIYAYP